MLASDTAGLGSESIAVGLFTNDFVPNPNSPLSAFTIAVNAGCDTVGSDTAGPSTWRDPTTGNYVIALDPDNNGNWTGTDSVGLPVEIFGGVVFVRPSGPVLFSERFDGSVTIAVVGDGFHWQPRLTINQGLLS